MNKLIVFEYNYEMIFNKLNRYISSCSGSSWDEIARKICKIARWEFKDYKDNLNRDE